MEPQPTDCPFCSKWDCVTGNRCSLCGTVFSVVTPANKLPRRKLKSSDDEIDDDDAEDSEEDTDTDTTVDVPVTIQEPSDHPRSLTALVYP